MLTVDIEEVDVAENTDTCQPEGVEEASPGSDWASEAEEALEGVGDALREAWDASREARLSALESAKLAAQQLGAAIDLGVAAARQKWDAQAEREPEPAVISESESAPMAPPAEVPKMGPDDGR